MKKLLLSTFAGAALAVVAGVVWFHGVPPPQVAAVYHGVERKLASLESREVDISGFRIAYLEGGEGEPLILVHGMGANKDEWNRVADQLTPHHRVIALDLPGFGDSDKPYDAGYLTSDQVHYLHQFVEALGLGPIHLGGNSMGGRVAAAYAAAYPEGVESLWLMAPAGVVSAQPSELASRLQQGERVPLVVRDREDLEASLELTTEQPPYYPGPVKEAFAQAARDNYRLHKRIMTELMQEYRGQPLENIVADLSVPTRIVWGEEDKVFHYSSAAVLHKLIHDSSVLLLPGTGHLPMIEAPEDLVEDYRHFRASLNKRS